MPQIVCSHRAADPCSAVIGDKALLSALCVCCVCFVTTMYACIGSCVCVCVCVGVFAGARACDGEHKQQHPTVLLPASLPICLCCVSALQSEAQ